MSSEEILEGNKLIARFMGYTYFPSNLEGIKDTGWKTTFDTSQMSKHNSANNFLGHLHVVNPDGSISKKGPSDYINKKYLTRSHHGLQYSNNWNWMMEVITKIEVLGFNIINEGKNDELWKEISLGNGGQGLTGFGSYVGITKNAAKSISEFNELDKSEVFNIHEIALYEYYEEPYQKLISYFKVVVQFINWYNQSNL